MLRPRPILLRDAAIYTGTGAQPECSMGAALRALPFCACHLYPEAGAGLSTGLGQRALGALSMSETKTGDRAKKEPGGTQ
jgi:hypothetical protein